MASNSMEHILPDKEKSENHSFSSIFCQLPWNTFLGDCSVVDEYLLDKPVNLKWGLAHFLNVFLRAVGQVRKRLKFQLHVLSAVVSAISQVRAAALATLFRNSQ